MAKEMISWRLKVFLLAPSLLGLLAAYFYWGRSEGILDLTSNEPKVVVSFELETEKTNQLLEKMKIASDAEAGLRISWMERLSDANVLVVAVKEWSHTLYFDDIAGLGDFARSASELSQHDSRTIYTINSQDGVVLVVVAYMVPDLDTWSFDCISENFAKALSDASQGTEDSFVQCLRSNELAPM